MSNEEKELADEENNDSDVNKKEEEENNDDNFDEFCVIEMEDNIPLSMVLDLLKLNHCYHVLHRSIILFYC